MPTLRRGRIVAYHGRRGTVDKVQKTLGYTWVIWADGSSDRVPTAELAVVKGSTTAVERPPGYRKLFGAYFFKAVEGGANVIIHGGPDADEWKIGGKLRDRLGGWWNPNFYKWRRADAAQDGVGAGWSVLLAKRVR